MSTQSTDDLEALARIVVAIKTYRFQNDDLQNPSQNPALDFYLKQHLSAYDWQLWERLQVSERHDLHALLMAQA